MSRVHAWMVRRLGALALTLGILGCATASPVPAGPTEVRPHAEDRSQRHRIVAAPRFTDPLRWPRLLWTLPKIDRQLRALVHDQALFGLAAGVVIDGHLVWSAGYGVRERDGDDPVTRDTVFRVGSLTKVLTAIAILRLRDRGVLQLDDAAAEHLPELRSLAYRSDDAREITIRELLTHSAGLPRNADVSTRAAPLAGETLLAALDGLGFANPGGTEVSYSNLGYQILGLLIGRATSTPYTEYMRREILGPLGMKSATFDPGSVPPARLAVGYEVRHGEFVERSRPTPLGAAAAAGELWASVPDLAALAAFELDAWPPRGGPDHGVLKRATVRESQEVGLLSALRARVVDEGKGIEAHATASGIGWQVREDCRLGRVVWHNGGLDGHRAALYMLPERGVAVILLSNTEYPLDATARTVLGLMSSSGGLVERTPATAPELDALAGAWHGLLGSWDIDAYRRDWMAYRYDELEDIEHQRAAMRAAATRLGPCGAPVRTEVVTPYHGKFALECEHGTAVLDLAVSPGKPARIIQDRVGLHGVAPDPAVVEAAGRVLALRQRWDEHAASELLAPVLLRPAIRTTLERLHANTGPCTLGAAEVSMPFGARLAMRCERAAGTIEVTMDAKLQRVIDFETELDEPQLAGRACGEP